MKYQVSILANNLEYISQHLNLSLLSLTIIYKLFPIDSFTKYLLSTSYVKTLIGNGQPDRQTNLKEYIG